MAFATYGSNVGLATADGDNYAWYIMQFVLLGFIGVGMLYYIMRELQSVYFQGWGYFGVAWNYIDMLCLYLNIAYIVIYFLNVDLEQLRVLAAISIFFNWIKLFDFLRIFQQTSAFMRMVFSILKGMSVFTFFLLMSFLTIGNSFYPLSRGFTPDDQAFLDNSKNFGNALFYGYSFAIG